MGNTSAADRDVWREFYGRWDILADNAVVMEPPPVVERGPRKRSVPMIAPTGPTEVTREATQRRGQYFFRAAVLAAHDGKCCITGITSEPLLRASHIIPWSHDPTLRLDPRNGLCLNALHDAAFDRGLITLSDRFELQVSKRVKSEVPRAIYKEMFESRAGSPIVMPERFQPAQEMLEFHRRNVFVA
ncbi:MAG: HNH endonuclease [Phycisphaerales bacterium]|nr:HNH endonuclease [Phycisphaerales bacterium]